MTEVSREELRELYQASVEEYGFNGRIGWERARYYLVPSAAILAAATGLQSAPGGRMQTLLSVMLFLLGAAVSVIGAHALTTSHRYYRASVIKKSNLERALGYNEPLPERIGAFAAPSIGTTPGMRDVSAGHDEAEAWLERPLRKGSIVAWLRAVLLMLALVHVMAAAVLAATAIAWP